jgi:hypothetical protein
MMRNFARINNYYNRLEAWKDWNALAQKYPDRAKQFQPPEDASWRTIDKRIGWLKNAIKREEIWDCNPAATGKEMDDAEK